MKKETVYNRIQSYEDQFIKQYPASAVAIRKSGSDCCALLEKNTWATIRPLINEKIKAFTDAADAIDKTQRESNLAFTTEQKEEIRQLSYAYTLYKKFLELITPEAMQAEMYTRMRQDNKPKHA